jgi:hypothetical protein
MLWSPKPMVQSPNWGRIAAITLSMISSGDPVEDVVRCAELRLSSCGF